MIDTQLFCKALKFAAHAAAKKDIRYYLKGVRIEWEGDTLRMIGTDGSRLARIEMRTSEASAVPIAATIGNDDVKRVLSTIGKDKGQVALFIEVSADPAQRAKVRITAGGVTLDLMGVEGIYPQWRRILPASGRVMGDMPYLDAILVAEACRAVEPFIVGYKGTRALLIQPGPLVTDVVNVIPAPGRILDPRVLECQVVIAPVRK